MDKLFESIIPAALHDEYYSSLVAIAENLGIKPEWLILMLNSESGLNPQAVCKLGPDIPGFNDKGVLIKRIGTPDHADPSIRCQYRATGQNQAMPKTSKWLGTDNMAYYKMNHVEQLYWIHQFYNPFKHKLDSYYTMYVANFMPAEVGMPDSTVLPKIAYNSNRGLDLNHDGQLTLGEFKAAALNHVPVQYRKYI